MGKNFSKTNSKSSEIMDLENNDQQQMQQESEIKNQQYDEQQLNDKQQKIGMNQKLNISLNQLFKSSRTIQTNEHETIKSIALSKNGKYMAVLARNLLIMDIYKNYMLIAKSTPEKNYSQSVTWANNSQLIATSDEHTIIIFEFKNDNLKQFCQFPSRHTSSIFTIRFCVNDIYLASSSYDNKVNIFDTLSCSGFVWPIEFSDNNKYLAAGTGAGNTSHVYVWDVQNNFTKIQQITNIHSNTIWSVHFSHDSKLLACGGSDNKTTILDVENNFQIFQVINISDIGWIRKVQFTYNGNHLYLGGSRHFVKVYTKNHKQNQYELDQDQTNRIQDLKLECEQQSIVISNYDRNVYLQSTQGVIVCLGNHKEYQLVQNMMCYLIYKNLYFSKLSRPYEVTKQIYEEMFDF